jgi:hypothetical protein
MATSSIPPENSELFQLNSAFFGLYSLHDRENKEKWYNRVRSRRRCTGLPTGLSRMRQVITMVRDFHIKGKTREKLRMPGSRIRTGIAIKIFSGKFSNRFSNQIRSAISGSKSIPEIYFQFDSRLKNRFRINLTGKA